MDRRRSDGSRLDGGGSEQRDALDVVGHREQVEGPQRRQPVALVGERCARSRASAAGSQATYAIAARAERRARASTTAAAGAGARRVEHDQVDAGPARAGAEPRSDPAAVQPRPAAGRAGCAGRRATARRPPRPRRPRPPGPTPSASAPANSPTPAVEVEQRARPAAAPAPSSTAATRASAAPGWTCQKPPAVDPPVASGRPARSDAAAARRGRPRRRRRRARRCADRRRRLDQHRLLAGPTERDDLDRRRRRASVATGHAAASDVADARSGSRRRGTTSCER